MKNQPKSYEYQIPNIFVVPIRNLLPLMFVNTNIDSVNISVYR